MLDMSIAQPIWPAVALVAVFALLAGAIIGRLSRQWRAFVFWSTFVWTATSYWFLPIPFWQIAAPLIGGMAFVAVAWFRAESADG